MVSDGPPPAHAIPDLGPATEHHGISVCGIPIEYVTVVPGMEWEATEQASRCPHCHDDVLLRQ